MLPLLSATIPNQGPPSRPDLTTSTVYEANLRAEGKSDAFSALTKRLPAIRSLGVDVLWLMPVTPTGKLRAATPLGSPYAVADYDHVNPEFGSVADFRALVAEAHRLKMRVLLDWVANHTAWDHPWIANKSWYTQNEKGEIVDPAGMGWKDVADLDFASRPMRKAMIASMQTWVKTYGVDGFRCDAAELVPTDFWREAITSLRTGSKRPLLMLAEGAKPELYGAGFDLTYGWEFSYRLREAYGGKSAKPVVQAMQKEAASAPVGREPIRFTTNHDWAAWDGSAIELFKSPVGAKNAFAVTAFSGGVPLVYTGQEIGWPDRIPIFDPISLPWQTGSDSARWITRLLDLRKTHPVLREGTTVDLSTEDAVAFQRSGKASLGGEETIVLANVRGLATTVPLPSEAAGTWNDVLTGTAVTVAGDQVLAPFETKVLVRTIRH